EEKGFQFAGSDAASSRLCMDKTATKNVAAAAGVPVPEGIVFSTEKLPNSAALVSRLGHDLVLKPNGEGSSIGLHFIQSETDLGAALAELSPGQWMIERRVMGRELTVG